MDRNNVCNYINRIGFWFKDINRKDGIGLFMQIISTVQN